MGAEACLGEAVTAIGGSIPTTDGRDPTPATSVRSRLSPSRLAAAPAPRPVRPWPDDRRRPAAVRRRRRGAPDQTLSSGAHRERPRTATGTTSTGCVERWDETTGRAAAVVTSGPSGAGHDEQGLPHGVSGLVEADLGDPAVGDQAPAGFDALGRQHVDDPLQVRVVLAGVAAAGLGLRDDLHDPRRQGRGRVRPRRHGGDDVGRSDALVHTDDERRPGPVDLRRHVGSDEQDGAGADEPEDGFADAAEEVTEQRDPRRRGHHQQRVGTTVDLAGDGRGDVVGLDDPSVGDWPALLGGPATELVRVDGRRRGAWRDLQDLDVDIGERSEGPGDGQGAVAVGLQVGDGDDVGEHRSSSRRWCTSMVRLPGERTQGSNVPGVARRSNPAGRLVTPGRRAPSVRRDPHRRRRSTHGVVVVGAPIVVAVDAVVVVSSTVSGIVALVATVSSSTAAVDGRGGGGGGIASAKNCGR